jgi:predicted acetylornithine/succinylornithine family transaminase
MTMAIVPPPSAVPAPASPLPPAGAIDAHVFTTYKRQPEVFVRGQGARLWDASGKEYLDFLGGIAVSALGHNHARLVAELSDQLGRLVHVSNLFRHPYTEAVAERVTRLARMEAVFFTNSGTEANEAALKLARKHQRVLGQPHRTGFVALEGSFHGRTLGALSVTHTAKYREPFEPLLPGVTFVPAGDAAALERALFDLRPAALILEPIQGESGVRDLDFAYLRTARELCDRSGSLLIFDEVQCGSGRSGTFLVAEQADVAPDVVTLAKSIAAGLPMGMCLASKALAQTLQPGDHGSTFAGGPLVCRGALVFLQELEEGGLLAAVRERGAQLAAGLEQLKRDHAVVLERRGRGLIQGLRLARGADDLKAALYARGLIVNVTGGDVIRLLPPYVISRAEVERGLGLLAEGLKAL